MILAVVGSVHGCGKSEHTGEGGDGDESTGGSGGALGGSAGTAGRAFGGSGGATTGGGGTAPCEALHCINGRLTNGDCSGSGYTPCDPRTAGVECVGVGLLCPRPGAGGTGGVGGVGGVAGLPSCVPPNHCDCLSCSNGQPGLSACPGTGFIPCDPLVSGVACVRSGRCPTLGDGGEGGLGGEGGA